MFLLDTNAVSDMSRNPYGPVAERVRATPPGEICTSIIVVAEIRFGLARADRPALARQVEKVLAAMAIAAFEEPADQIYGALRATLQRKGTPIGGNDLFIAAHALALGCTLVTDNVHEFERVDGLLVENWLRVEP